MQALEIAIDALDIPLVRPFWKAITGYADEPGSELQAALVDPSGRGPRSGSSRWMRRGRSAIGSTSTSTCRTRRPGARIDAAIAAGGRLLSDAAAPAFWVLADPEGNEACICTWQGRD